MKKVYRYGLRGCLWCYSVLVIGGWALHSVIGDRLWWLALLSSFTPQFFLPLLLLWPFGAWLGSRADRLVLGFPTLLFLYLYGALFLPQQPPPTQADMRPLRLMTFNMWEGNRRLTDTVKVIWDNDLPDIVALQEVSYSMQRALVKTLGAHYPQRDFGHSGRGGLGVLSRYPLKRVSSDLLIDLFCRQYQVTVDADHHFRLYNCHPYSTHFTYPTNNWTPLIRQVEETFRMRTLLGERLAQEIRGHGEATIVLGDFNTTDQSDAYRHITTILVDTHRAVGWGFGHTFPAGTALFRKPPVLPRLVRIDMIFYSPAFVARQTAVGATYGYSDHLPLMATLAWRQSP